MLKRRMEKEITDIDFLTKEQLKQKVTTILKLVTEFDDHVFEINNIGWTAGSPIPESQQLLDVLLSNNESQFRVFISSLFISFVESMDRAGKSKGKKKYFWKEFKEEYPEIQKVLHKIRLYRHSTEHTSLEDQYKPSYFQFLKEDLGGSLPIFWKTDI